MSYDFVFDDSFYVLENPIIKSFSSSNLYKMAVGEQSPTWHPLTWLSHALDYKLYWAIQLKPRNPNAYHDLGALFLKKGLLGKSETELKTAIDLKPEYHQAYHNLSLVYRDQGLTDKAIAQ